jgi:hypothetical protein
VQPRGQDLLATLWRHVAAKRPATRRRWPWSWGGADRVFTTSGQPLGLVGPWESGQEPRVRRGLDGLWRRVVSGAGTLLIPGDFPVRRPDPVGPGRPGRDQLTWLRVMRERTYPALPRLGLVRPPPWSWPIVGVATRSCWGTSRTTSMGGWGWRARAPLAASGPTDGGSPARTC